MKNPAVIADPIAALLNEAGRYLGTREEPAGSNRGTFIDAWLRECRVGLGLPWCSAWVFAMGRQALGHAWPVPRTALVQDLYDWGQARGYVQTSARPGDLLVLYYPTLRRYAHVAIVTELTETGLRTIEGNTCDPASPATREGWGVFRRSRPVSERMGFVRWIHALPRGKVVEVLGILACMLFAGTLWATLQDVELEARLHAANATIALYADSVGLLRALCFPSPTAVRPPTRPLLMTSDEGR